MKQTAFGNISYHRVYFLFDDGNVTKNKIDSFHCTVVELYREGVTKPFHQMEVNETFILFLHLANEIKYMMSHVSKKGLFLLKMIKNE